MGFTGYLATADSQLGNIFLSAGGSSGLIDTETASNVLSLSQSVSVQIVKLESVANTLVFTESAVEFETITRTLNNILFTQSARGFSGTKSCLHTLVLNQLIQEQIFYERSIVDSFIIHQLAECTHIIPAHNTFVISQSASASQTTLASNVLTLTETLDLTWTHSDFPFNVLNFQPLISMPTFRSRTLSQTFTIHQAATALRIRFYSAHNTFVMAQDAILIHVLKPNNFFPIDQAIFCNRFSNPKPSNFLHLSQNVTCVLSLVRSVSNQLTFQSVFMQPMSIGGIYDNEPGFQTDFGGPQEQSYVPIPTVMVTKVEKIVTLRSDKQSVVLKAPYFGDSEAGLNVMDMKRTINAQYFTYCKKTPRRELKYKFWVDRQKQRELRYFFLNNMSNPVYMTNWKGEIWVGYVKNNPLDMTSVNRGYPCGDTYEFDLELSAEKIHG